MRRRPDAKDHPVPVVQQDATSFYVAIFKNSKIKGITRFGGAGPGPNGSVMTVALDLDCQG